MENNGKAGSHSIDLVAALGANESVSVQCFTIYVPNKDREAARPATNGSGCSKRSSFSPS